MKFGGVYLHILGPNRHSHRCRANNPDPPVVASLAGG